MQCGAAERYELYSILEQEVKRTSQHVVKGLNLERRNYGSVFEVCKQNFKTQDEINFITEWLIRKITYLQNFSSYIILKISEKLKTESYKTGDTIIREGDDGDRVMFLFAGEVDIVKNDK